MRVTNVIPFGGPSQDSTTQPSNVVAEAALLGAVLIENAVLDKCSALAAEDFYEPLHARIWQKIKDLTSAGSVANAALLRPYFEADEAIQEIGGVVYLARLSADGSGLLAAKDLAEQIRDLAALRRAKATMAGALGSEFTSRGELLALLKEAIDPGGATPSKSDNFDLLSLAELESLEPPAYLVSGLIAEDGTSFIYGPSGVGKSFVAVDMALRITLGMDWHGLRTKRAGVLYIAGEGARGLGKRVTGWRMKHNISLEGAPFMLLPIAVQLMEPDQRTKLLRTIDEAKRRMNFEIGLTVIDTVSKSIAGQDENGQQAMSAFDAACDEIRAHTGGAVIGVHHSGKDIERGMRGSSVLFGGAAAVIKLTKDEDVVTLECEKQKDDEEIAPLFFEFEKISWNTGSPDNPGVDLSTLVPVRRSQTPQVSTDGAINRDKIARAFGMMTDAWASGKPLSNKPQSRESGRYAPTVFALKIGGDAAEWKGLIDAWLINGAVVFEVYDKKNHISGLRVIEPIW